MGAIHREGGSCFHFSMKCVKSVDTFYSGQSGIIRNTISLPPDRFMISLKPFAELFTGLIDCTKCLKGQFNCNEINMIPCYC